MLAELMTNYKEWIVTFHEHDSLLENIVEQELSEEEKKAAWEDYEEEKKGLRGKINCSLQFFSTNDIFQKVIFQLALYSRVLS